MRYLSFPLEHAEDLTHERQHLEHAPRGLPQTQGVAGVPHQQVRVLRSDARRATGRCLRDLRRRNVEVSQSGDDGQTGLARYYEGDIMRNEGGRLPGW